MPSFVDHHERRAFHELPRENPFWRPLLYCSAAAVALAATRPWTQIRFPRLHDLLHNLLGPPAWQSNVGFTCLCTCALVAVMTLGETRTPNTQAAVRPASLLLVSLALVSLLFDWSRGPADLRGVSTGWTWAFYVAAVSLPCLWLTCAVRERLRHRRARWQRSDVDR